MISKPLSQPSLLYFFNTLSFILPDLPSKYFVDLTLSSYLEDACVFWAMLSLFFVLFHTV